jgi:proline racemase
VPLELAGHGTILVDTAYGGDSFVLAEAKSFGFQMLPDEARDIAMMGRKIVNAANAQLGFSHPTLPGWNHFSFCFMTGPLERVDGSLSSRNACVVKPGKLDRSPTGTGCSAFMAVLHAKGLLRVGEDFIGRSIIESRFTGHIESETIVGIHKAIIPTISGRAWISGQSTLMLDPGDPWPAGYRISDTWPKDVQ